MSVTEPLVIKRNSRGIGSTYLNSESFGYTWTIHNFSHISFRSDTSSLKSPIFQTLHNESVMSWYIQLSDNADNPELDMVFAVYCKVSKECKISAKADFSIINRNNEKNINLHKTINTVFKPELGFYLAWSVKDFWRSRADLAKINSGFCPNDKLTVTFDIVLATDQLTEQISNIRPRAIFD